MAKEPLRTAPSSTTGLPPGIPYILTNEFCERFAYYGMTGILVMFMHGYLLGADGALSVMTDVQSQEWFHWFTAGTYFMAVLGALVSDVWLGKYRTIYFFSLLYCLGFVVMAIDQTRLGLMGGMALIAIGAGSVKPCVTANVGDQFGASNKHLVSKIYSWFYFSINLGALISMLLCPYLLKHYGPKWAFGVPAAAMMLATLAFRMGKRSYVHIPPTGRQVLRDLFNRETLTILGRISVIMIFVSMIFALFYQSQGAWVLQAKKMELRWLWINWIPAQFQAVNCLLILILIPVFNYAIYPAIDRVFPLTALRKIGLGMFVTASAFLVSIWIENQIAAGGTPSIGWQFLAYVPLTAGEIMVSITVLEFSYTQAPKRLKSFVMALYLLAISLGNAIPAIVNAFIQNPDGSSKLPGASYYWFFLIVMVVTATLFIPVAKRYVVQEYYHEEE